MSNIDLSKPGSDRADYRRSIVKELYINRGITNKAEILRLLISEYGFPKDTSRQLVYRDVHAVSRLSKSEFEDFAGGVMGSASGLIEDQKRDIESEADPSKRSHMRKDLFIMMEKKARFAKDLFFDDVGGEVVDGVEKSRVERVTSISFDSSEKKEENKE